MKLSFVKSAEKPEHWPQVQGKEIALAGRSNAGKSSLLNALAHQKIAKVSQVPGKTRLLNFFRVQDKAWLVDMPGYGYAARPASERDQWRDMVESYLHNREQLCALLLIMDIRRDWTEEEQLLLNWCQKEGKPLYLVLTKADKLSKSKILEKCRNIRELCYNSQGVEEVFAVSNAKKTGIKELEKFLLKVLIPS